MKAILDIGTQLQNEVKLSKASVTGYSIACAIVTENGVYLDHNHEHEASLTFEHAEARALKKMLKSESLPKIKKIVMYGEGKVQKFKHYVPCCICSNELKPYTSSETVIDLMPLKETDSMLSLNFNEVLASYESKEYSKIEAGSDQAYALILEDKTLLNERDRKFILDLVSFGRKSHVSLFLTGSASGRRNILIKNKSEHLPALWRIFLVSRWKIFFAFRGGSDRMQMLE